MSARSVSCRDWTRNLWVVWLTVLLTGGEPAARAAEPPIPEKIEFNRDVRPILSDNCFFCHGPDAGHRKADLRLDIREDALSAKAFTPGQPDASSLVERILSDDKMEVMPPPESNKSLAPRQKEILKRWIAQGANYQRHWSYEPPVKTAIPSGKSAIDHLVALRLTEIGLKPSPSADKRTLVRRLYADLVGLPPTVAEVDAFVNDASPDAYAKLVEKLLASPHHGERMAIGWLDVVRFADTIGYHSDNPRNVWPYRDYVIKSFHENKRFDRFTIEQVAGDLLPDANVETRVASAYNRLLLTTEEGGAQAKDYEARMMADRVRSIGTTWLGQTTGCAQCHDHKFDPFTTRDFYRLGAFFADIQEPIIGRREDGMAVTTPEQDLKLAALDSALVEARKKFDAILPALDAAQKQWERDVIAYGATLPELKEGSTAPEPEKANARQVAEQLKNEKRNPQQSQLVQTYFRTKAAGVFADERDGFAKAERERNEFYGALPKVTVSTSGAKRTVRVLPRGNWLDESGEVVKAALPGYLPGPTFADREPNRLDLANWLVSRDNPLTARTMMNRLWKQFFGSGLSRVLDDLGAQGEPPLNAPLLDWLAVEFMESGWDVRHMIRLMVLSDTYRQTSVPTPELLAIDPFNREYARQSAFRLDAELVRDTALSASGLLVPRIGGPSVKPYQPDGYWENLNFPTRTYPNDTGESQYRRGLYTWWQRSFLHPSMVAFDAPAREECSAERTRSNIPQQALVLLNDPTYVEAARVLAAAILKDGGANLETRIDWAWRRVLQRSPDAEELRISRELVERHAATYKGNVAGAESLLKVGLAPMPEGVDKIELAAWTHLARVLLNLHETITRS
jgi:hypothetical protein